MAISDRIPNSKATVGATRRISAITIGVRHRRDLGDIEGLAASIAEVGLLHPVVITPGNVLIAGERPRERRGGDPNAIEMPEPCSRRGGGSHERSEA